MPNSNTRNSRPMPVALSVALCAALLAGCAKPAATADTGKIAGDIRALETRWEADFNAKDAAKVAAYYDPDATLMLPGGPAMTGTAAITAGLTEGFKDPAFAVHFKADKVGVSAAGDLAYSQGTARETGTDPVTRKPVTSEESYVTVYKHEPDGSWKAVEDIVTLTPPAPPAKS